MKIVAETGRDDLAKVFIAEFAGGRQVEFTEAQTPPLGIEEKWVLTCSTLFGCPGRCLFCDAGDHYRGRLSPSQILTQLDYLVRRRFPDLAVPAKKFKIQLARMGEPSLNPAVLKVLEILPARYRAPGLIASLSTVAPRGGGDFFERLRPIKDERYLPGHFQLQFSIHTTDSALRDRLMPIPKWSLGEIADYGARFYTRGRDRQITLNFALMKGHPCEAGELARYFDPDIFLIKITPLNPTFRARENGLQSLVDDLSPAPLQSQLSALRGAGYQVVFSYGEREENLIGSNCGQYLKAALQSPAPHPDSYTYAPAAPAAGPGQPTIP